ncbi:MAG: TssN family type VI secretion system protein [Bacteroidia bacterium]
MGIFNSSLGSAPKVNLGTASKINSSPNKRFIWYFLLISLGCSLSGLVLLSGHDDAGKLFVWLQITTLLFACFHIYYINTRLVWLENLQFLKKLFFTLGITMGSMLFFFLLGKFLVLRKAPDYIPLFLPAFLVFVIPFFFIATFDKAMQIPMRKYKLWFYNENAKMPDLDLIDFSNSYILSFEFPKKYNDTSISNFKFKAPVDMQFGELFFMYITEYNDKNRENPIEFQDSMSKAYGWIFYIKPASWWKRKRILDPHLTVKQNQIKEHEVIAPKRFVVS